MKKSLEYSSIRYNIRSLLSKTTFRRFVACTFLTRTWSSPHACRFTLTDAKQDNGEVPKPVDHGSMTHIQYSQLSRFDQDRDAIHACFAQTMMLQIVRARS